MRSWLSLFPLLVLSLGAQTKDISGTWVAKMTTPMGDMEIVYRLKVDPGGNITGTQSLPFGDAPIKGGKLNGDSFEFTVEVESFGNLQQRQVKGKVLGDELQLTPALPGPPPPSNGPRAPGAPSDGPGARITTGVIIARRGTPTPSYRTSVDYKTLPRVELPVLGEIAATGEAPTPPMGWNSWNKFHTRIDDRTVRDISDAIVTSGLRDAGYRYVNIDDGWQGKRDESGVLQPNPQFPNMKALAEYVHSKGLKLGIYSSPGPQTCGGFAGSYGHEEIDAKTWAEWGIDYLKYDWCSAARIWKDSDMRGVYQRMGEALHKSGRPMVLSLCQYGRANVTDWGPKVGGSLWRTTRDIQDRWDSMSQIGFSQSDLARITAPGHWNDPDMLEVGNGGMSADEYRTHLSLWAMIAAPLIAGNDVRTMSADIKGILLNREVIAVDQDSLGKGGYRVGQGGENEVWVKPLQGGAFGVALFNRGTGEKQIAVKWSDLDLTGSFRVRDLWGHADLGIKESGWETTVRSHGVAMIRISAP